MGVTLNMRIKNVESLTLQNDFLFCTVFTTNEKLLKELVEIITGRKVKEIKAMYPTADGKLIAETVKQYIQ